MMAAAGANRTDPAPFMEMISSMEEPAELTELRKEALDRFLSLDLPSREDESWRKTNLSDLDLGALKPEGSRSASEFPLGIPDGVRVLSFAEALKEDGLKERILGRLRQSLEEEKDNIFSMMNLALNRGPLVVHATGAAECSFKILHRLTEGDALMQRVLILLDQSAELTLVEEFQGTPSDSLVLWNPVTEVVAEDNSSLNYVALRYYTDSEYHFHRFTSDQKRDSRIHYAVIHTGGALGKSFTVARIHDRDATFRGIGVAIGTGRQYNDAEMVVEHHADHTASSLLYKTVLKGRAHSVFNGNLVIPPGRRQVESIQMNYNILLDRKARAESMPKLVTRSENVSCEHGATVGELDEEAIFFLMARGLPHSEARDLLIQGFYSEVVEEIPLSGEEHQAIEAIIKERIDS